MPLLGSLLAFVALTQGSYRVQSGSVAAEFIPADSKMLSEAASLLTHGKVSLLKDWARSKDWKKSQAARLVLLGSGDLAHLPLLLEGLQPPGRANSYVGFKAIQLYPEQSWPLLVRMAEQGIPEAVRGIALYIELGQPELLRLSRNSKASVRANAIPYVAGKDRLIEALGDTSIEVRREAIKRLVWFRDFDYVPYLSEKHGAVRELFAEYAHRWVKHDLRPWIVLTRDKSKAMRKWALLHLAVIGVEPMDRAQTSQAIQAVRNAFVNGPPDVYHPAAMAVRGWLVEWHWISDRWTPQQIAAAKAIFKLPKYRDAVYHQALSEGLDDRPGAVEVLGIRMRLALHALILSQDPRALALASKVIDRGYPSLIPLLSNLPGSKTVDYLFSLIEKTSFKGTETPPDTEDYNATQFYDGAVGSLRRLGVRDWSRALKLLHSSKVHPLLRAGLARSLAPVGTPAVAKGMQTLFARKRLSQWQRGQVLFAMQFCPDPSIGPFLEQVAQSEADPLLRRSAGGVLAKWRTAFRKPKPQDRHSDLLTF